MYSLVSCVCCPSSKRDVNLNASFTWLNKEKEKKPKPNNNTLLLLPRSGLRRAIRRLLTSV